MADGRLDATFQALANAGVSPHTQFRALMEVLVPGQDYRAMVLKMVNWMREVADGFNKDLPSRPKLVISDLAPGLFTKGYPSEDDIVKQWQMIGGFWRNKADREKYYEDAVRYFSEFVVDAQLDGPVGIGGSKAPKEKRDQMIKRHVDNGISNKDDIRDRTQQIIKWSTMFLYREATQIFKDAAEKAGGRTNEQGVVLEMKKSMKNELTNALVEDNAELERRTKDILESLIPKCSISQ